ncbi:MAG: hypothetical protein GX222_02750 [Ruminococcaceae bacterium]|nr:hypothetical protein [Oscillospiraceae bacterium]
MSKLNKILSSKENRIEFVIIAAIVLVSIVSIICYRINLSDMINRSETGYIAEVIFEGETIMTIDLSNEGIYHIDGKLPVTLRVTGGRIQFINSVCPDHICESYGLIPSEINDTAVCLPARVVVKVKPK